MKARARGLAFSRGHDPRRHTLTREEQSRGGRVSWARYMRQWYTELCCRPCPQCGGDAIPDGQRWRCTRCGYTWCDGCGDTSAEGGGA